MISISRTLFALPFIASSVMLEAAEKPNFIVILVDDLGCGDVSSLFRKVVKTPNIDRLAKEGVTFESSYVPVPLCGPSRAGYLTGQYPQRFGFSDNSGGIPTDLTLLPMAMQKAGYITGHFGKWHSTGPMPFERGCYNETLCSVKSSPFIDYYNFRLSRNGKVEAFNEYSTDLFARETEAFIDKYKNQPFHLTVAFNAVHIRTVVKNAELIAEEFEAKRAKGENFVVPIATMARPEDIAQFRKEFPNDSSRAELVATLHALDQAVGRILDKLKSTGLDKNTVVIFFGDNGAHPENRSENHPLREYKWSLFEGGIRNPFFAVYPGVFPAGLRYNQPVSSLDIFPTCTALANAETPSNIDGVNLTPYITGKVKTAPHEYLFFKFRNLHAIRSGKWKLFYENVTKPELYDISTDISEKNNLASSHPEITNDLIAKWNVWNSQISAETKK